mgnify:CR=1 FL=1
MCLSLSPKAGGVVFPEVNRGQSRMVGPAWRLECGLWRIWSTERSGGPRCSYEPPPPGAGGISVCMESVCMKSAGSGDDGGWVKKV